MIYISLIYHLKYSKINRLMDTKYVYIKIVLEFISLICALNYISSQIAKVHHSLLFQPYQDSKSDTRWTFLYFDSLMFVNKSIILIFCWTCIKYWRENSPKADSS